MRSVLLIRMSMPILAADSPGRTCRLMKEG